ncbi:MAG: heme lyase CcmF/NrfE family subunit [Burkholderiaceae bacterium]
MLIELGHYAIALAFTLSVVLGVVPMLGAARGNQAMMAVARPAAFGVFVFNAFAFACLMNAFLTHDFSVKLVASHSNSALPDLLRMAATWGSHEGSLLLWTFMLAGWTFAVALFSRSLSDVLRARILSVMGLIGVGFLAFLLFTSNPFERLLPPVPDGRDLNPLLQDPGMIFHPPLLYMGYVGLSVAFAFAVAGLMGGHLDAAWARWARPWTTVAWSFLTLGIALGSFWAYYELGWGGWWFWDPVENASFMPWLVATALIHSLAVTEKRGSFKSWTVLLAIAGFSLSLLGTFLVRSGVLTSVHAFATDPARGTYILIFLLIVVGGSLTLFAARAHKVGLGNRFGLFSRESLLLANNIVLVNAMAAVLLGTLAPLIFDALNLGKLSVGQPFFDLVFPLLMAPGLFLMGVGPLLKWKSDNIPDVASRLRWALIVSIAAGLLTPLVASFFGANGSAFRPLASLGLSFGFWIIASVLVSAVDALRGADGRFVPANAWRRARMHPSSVWGMHLAHLGVGAFVLGATAVTAYESHAEASIKVGDDLNVGPYTVRFDSLDSLTGPNYRGAVGTFSVFEASQGTADKPIAVLRPEKRVYNVSGQAMTEAAINRSLAGDVYVSMGEPLGNQTWVIRAHIKPWINWIWLGCVMMAVGGFLAVADRRYRRTRRQQAKANTGATARA